MIPVYQLQVGPGEEDTEAGKALSTPATHHDPTVPP